MLNDLAEAIRRWTEKKFLEDLDATQEDLVLNFQSSCMILVAME